ncbi:hypothetical protein SLE2022_260480 [Rubroshorea leprosula]
MGKSSSRVESKADRKFEKKVEFYAKVRDSVVASLTAKKAITKKKKLRPRQKKLKAYDLSSLSEFLPDAEWKGAKRPEADLKLNCKSRQKLILKEAEHLNAVIKDPAFQADPLAAIYQHLERTQPVSDVKEKKKAKKNGSKRRKGKSKVSSGSQSMDI